MKSSIQILCPQKKKEFKKNQNTNSLLNTVQSDIIGWT